MTTVGLLHTVPALAATFDDLVRAQAPDLRRIHIADAWLLDTARREGVTSTVERTVAEHVRHLQERGAAAILVTCSSIGEAAEVAASTVSTVSTAPVVRVDAAMAEEAVAVATAPGARGRIAVLATLPSTLGPTGRLVERAARGATGPVEVTATVVDGAAEANDRGDRDRVDDLVAAAVRKADADVIVLAQASMARAAARVDAAVPVLSSPAGGVAALLRALGR